MTIWPVWVGVSGGGGGRWEEGRGAYLGIPKGNVAAILVDVAVGIEEAFPILPRCDEGRHRGGLFVCWWSGSRLRVDDTEVHHQVPREDTRRVGGEVECEQVGAIWSVIEVQSRWKTGKTRGGNGMQGGRKG